MKKVDVDDIYDKIKNGIPKFNEELHCKMILRIMSDPKNGRLSSFCAAAGISDHKFYRWLNQSEIFLECYALAKIFARETWEKDGEEIANEVHMPGTANYRFEHWRMVGWSRFGVGKNSRIRLNLNPLDGPNEHYSQLLSQASQGDFTAGEIKQLMEAVNVGLNTHQVFALQKEIDQLKADLATMTENTNVYNTISTQGITKKD